MIRYWFANILLLLASVLGLLAVPVNGLIHWAEKTRIKLIIGQINKDRSQVNNELNDFSYKTGLGNNSNN